MTHELMRQAHRDYGDLIDHVVLWPPGLGIDVHLIGGDVVQIFPSGERYVVDQPSGWTKTLRRMARLRGVVGRLTRKP